jgi:hypothetical protein
MAKKSMIYPKIAIVATLLSIVIGFCADIFEEEAGE